jgi:phosphoglycolate phosphatase-like HAD superfamily hydrolase
MIGDRMLDVECGHRAGCRSILVGERETPSTEPTFRAPDFICADLLAAARVITSA